MTSVLAGAARGGTRSKGGGGLVRLSDVDTRELAGFENYHLFIIFHRHLYSPAMSTGSS